MRFVVTGFSRFGGVKDNPTEWLVQHLEEYLTKRQSPAQVHRCSVLKVSAKTAQEWVREQLRQCCDEGIAGSKAVMIHLGLNVSTTHFDLERVAYNCADFRIPDEDGWEPKAQPIENEAGMTTYSCRLTTLPVEAVTDSLRQRGHSVRTSGDAGRFVCNWIYYNSLILQDTAEKPWQSLFVHVPDFQYIPADKQLEFLGDLLEELQAAEEARLPPESS
mmetsp:Transcript_22088/g.56617  ORF Transcript_22088/g.56617 Transcript_22088/m.56617 type:complete len:218 (+) Transcript_22088:187-840(+)|eukprot:jgi/Tetstr1/424027/TSEL_014638.t1